jgi:phosphate:Na+ symporter
MFFNVIGGLGIFLLGIKYMSEGLQTIAGNRLRTLIGAMTRNRLMAMAVGTGVTCLVQSSSVTTVMVVGFVNAGFMTLGQAIGVIMGANIGTTITGWILVLTIGKYGLPLLGISALVFRFSRREGLRYLAMATMGVGMVFFGLELMKNGFRPIRQMEEFSKWFVAFSADNYFGVLKCAMVGCVLTMIVQSSSATLGITIGLAATGVIRFEAAAALVLGENIGTTITACLASIGTTTNAKRAAYAHVIFNLTGVAWITTLFGPYLVVVKHFLGDGFTNLEELNPRQVTAAIAAVHTGFNVTNTLVFLPFTRRLADFLTRLVPERAYREPPHLTKLDSRLLTTPVIGVEQSRIEILRMADMLRKMLFRVGAIISSKAADDQSVKKVFHTEEVMDIMQKEVTIFLTDLLSASVTHDVADEARRLLRMADEYESISDYTANIVKLHLRLHESNLELSPIDRQNILELHQEVQDYVEMVKTGYEENHPEIVSKAHTRGDGVTHRIRELRNQHLVQVAQRHSEPLMTVIYTDMLNAYRRVKDHAMNVAEVVAGEK